jgi:hypothetical protein
MITGFSTADEAIDETIRDMCKEIKRTHADDAKFMPLVDAVAKLRASQNPIIQQAPTE